MKNLLLLSTAILLLLFALQPVHAQAAAPQGNVTLEWSSTNQLTTNIVYKLYFSTNVAIPMTSWTVLTNISGVSTTTTVRIIPGEGYFSMTASNMWGETPFSNVAPTHALPTSPTKVLIKQVN